MSFNLKEQSDRRLWERFPARFPARVKDARDRFGESLTLCDASATGARFQSKERFYLNDSIAIEIQVPDGQDPLNMKGEVVWAREDDNGNWEIGLRFYRSEFMRLTRLYKFVNPSLD